MGELRKYGALENLRQSMYFLTVREHMTVYVLYPADFLILVSHVVPVHTGSLLAAKHSITDMCVMFYLYEVSARLSTEKIGFLKNR